MARVSQGVQVPLSRTVDVALVGADGLKIAPSADLAERTALAVLNGLVGIDELRADLVLRREGRSGIHLTGTLSARITQTCVLTLEPFTSDLVEPIDLHFLPAREIEARTGMTATPVRSSDGEEADEDPPEPIVNNRIDIGRLMAEFLSLGLDPYPKKPGADFAEHKPAVDEEKISPFQALGRLKPERPN